MRTSLGIRRRAFNAIPHSIPLAVRFWRLNITDSNDYPAGGNAQGLYVTIGDINFRPTPGTNVAMSSLGTASASSTYQNNSTYGPNAAIDADKSGTGWICASGQGQSSQWQFTYTNPVQIKQVALNNFGGTLGAVQMLKSATLQRSLTGAAGTWINVLSITNQTGWSTATIGETRLFTVP